MPTISETYKTYDGKYFYKITDVCQVGSSKKNVSLVLRFFYLFHIYSRYKCVQVLTFLLSHLDTLWLPFFALLYPGHDDINIRVFQVLDCTLDSKQEEVKGALPGLFSTDIQHGLGVGHEE